MADPRSVMKEYRALEQKRQAGGLSPQEETRLVQLRELVGPETGVGLAKPGFDVNAAAARLRESLLPGGLRNRPPPMPEAAPAFEPEQPPAADVALAAEWNAAPFAPLTETEGLSADALFDPGTLGEEPPPHEATGAAWDPNAQPYDPNAVAYDQNGQPYYPNAVAYDQNGQPYDPNAVAYDQNGQPYDPNAVAYDPNAQPYDPNAVAYDPNAQPYDPNAVAYDPNAQPYDPNAVAYDPNAQPYDPNAVAYDPNAQPYDPGAAGWDPNATPQWDAAVQPAEDPNLAAPWGDAVAVEPSPEPEPVETNGWDASAFPAEEQPAQEPELASEPLAEPELLSDVEPVPVADLEPAPELEPVLESDPAAEPEPEPELQPETALEPAPEPPPEELLPFDAAAASAIAPDAALEGWDSASLLAPLGAGQELTSEDDAFAQGFQLESNGSFGGAGEPTEPTWKSAAPEPGTEDWESAPTLDLGAMPPAAEVPPLDLSAGDAQLAPLDAPAPEPEPPPSLAPPGEHDALEEIEVEEIPIDAALSVRIDGAHRVVVHTVEGLVKRGSITDAMLDAPSLPLAPQPGAAPEELPTSKVKAIFFMLSPGEKAPAAEGKKVRVTFTDGRQIAGFSPDYSDAGPGFFMIPADTRTNTGRIWVYRAAVKSVAVS
jgi:hypothetical protein